MIGKLYVGPHERLQGVVASNSLKPSRLSEIDFVHPRDIPAVMKALPESLERWTNNWIAVCAVPPERIYVLTVHGPRRLTDHPFWLDPSNNDDSERDWWENGWPA